MIARAMFLLVASVVLVLAGIVYYSHLENRLVFYPARDFDDSPSNWNLSYRLVVLKATNDKPEKFYGCK